MAAADVIPSEAVFHLPRPASPCTSSPAASSSPDLASLSGDSAASTSASATTTLPIERRGAASSPDLVQALEVALEAAAEDAGLPPKSKSQQDLPAARVNSSSSASASKNLSPRSRRRRAQLKTWLFNNGFSTVQSTRRKLGVTSTALHVAVRQFDVDMVDILLEFGADPLKTNSWGETPEDLAIRKQSRGDPRAVDDIIAMLQDATDALQPEYDEEED